MTGTALSAFQRRSLTDPSRGQGQHLKQSKPGVRLRRLTGRIGNRVGGGAVKVEATLWINGDGFPQATLHLPSGDVMLQIPSKDPKGNVRASKP